MHQIVIRIDCGDSPTKASPPPKPVLQGPAPPSQRIDCRGRIQQRHQSPSCPSLTLASSNQDGKAEPFSSVAAFLAGSDWTSKPGPGSHLPPDDPENPRQRVPVWIDKRHRLRQMIGQEPDPYDPVMPENAATTVTQSPTSPTGYSARLSNHGPHLPRPFSEDMPGQSHKFLPPASSTDAT